MGQESLLPMLVVVPEVVPQEVAVANQVVLPEDIQEAEGQA